MGIDDVERSVSIREVVNGFLLKRHIRYIGFSTLLPSVRNDPRYDVDADYLPVRDLTGQAHGDRPRTTANIKDPHPTLKVRQKERSGTLGGAASMLFNDRNLMTVGVHVFSHKPNVVGGRPLAVARTEAPTYAVPKGHNYPKGTEQKLETQPWL